MTSAPTAVPSAVARSGELDALADLVGAGDVVVLSGAGLSTDSGIPDYRGATGSLRRHTPMTYQTFTRDPRGRHRYWARSFVGWRQIRGGPAQRRAPARSPTCSAPGCSSGVITQNVDGLHQAGGARDVVELHGGLDRTVCLSCGDVAVARGARRAAAGGEPGLRAAGRRGQPRRRRRAARRACSTGSSWSDCLACGDGPLKPDVVFFGETVPRDRVDALLRAASSRPASLLVLGSSLTVMSGYRFVLRAAKLGIPVAIVNAGPTRGDAKADVRVDAPARRRPAGAGPPAG